MNSRELSLALDSLEAWGGQTRPSALLKTQDISSSYQNWRLTWGMERVCQQKPLLYKGLGTQNGGSRQSRSRGGVQSPWVPWPPFFTRGSLSQNIILNVPPAMVLLHLNESVCSSLPFRGDGGTCGSAGTVGQILYLLVFAESLCKQGLAELVPCIKVTTAVDWTVIRPDSCVK